MSYFNTSGLTRRQQAVYDLVARSRDRGLGVKQLIWLVYNDHPPASANVAIRVFVHQLNKRLEGERIRCNRQDFRYRVVKNALRG